MIPSETLADLNREMERATACSVCRLQRPVTVDGLCEHCAESVGLLGRILAHPSPYGKVER